MGGGGGAVCHDKKNLINKAKNGFNCTAIAFQRVSTKCWLKNLSGKNNLEHFGVNKNMILNVFNTGVLISPYLDLLPDVFCLMVRIFRLMLVLFYVYIYI